MRRLSYGRQAVALVSNGDALARLYHAVILRAVQDLALMQYRDKAREWLLSPESDHAFTAAGISQHGVRQQVI